MPAFTAREPSTLSRRQWSQWAAATALGSLTGTALAQDLRYPGKAIRMVIPFTPGGSADILGRAIGHDGGELSDVAERGRQLAVY